MTTLEIPVRPHTTTGVTPTLGRKAFVEQVMGMPVSVHIRATEPTRVYNVLTMLAGNLLLLLIGWLLVTGLNSHGFR